MDDLSCPNCKTTKYRKPDLVLLVNVCGHSLCDHCVNRLFLKGAGECPECKLTLRRNNYRVQQFEDSFVDKECEVRRKVLAIYNKKELDFKSLRDYNDYLEEVETIIYNLVNGIDVEETKLKMERHKEQNKDVIMKNRYKMSEDEVLLDQLIQEERELHEATQKCTQDEEQRLRQQRQRQRDELIDDLMFSDLPANRILENHRKDTVTNHLVTSVISMDLVTSVPSKPNKFSSGISIGVSHETVPLTRVATVSELFIYKTLKFDWMGPNPPSRDDIASRSYLRHIRAASVAEMAGGYESFIACQRALQDAFCGMCFVATETRDVTNCS